jgi:hypothetical protein
MGSGGFVCEAIADICGLEFGRNGRPEDVLSEATELPTLTVCLDLQRRV